VHADVTPNETCGHPGAPLQLASSNIASAISTLTSTRYKFFMNCLHLSFAVRTACCTRQGCTRQDCTRQDCTRQE
jgi:hypothetical protein